MNHFLAKFKHWIESNWLSDTTMMVAIMINMVTMMTKIVVVGVWGNLLEGDNGEVWHWQGARW